MLSLVCEELLKYVGLLSYTESTTLYPDLRRYNIEQGYADTSSIMQWCYNVIGLSIGSTITEQKQKGYLVSTPIIGDLIFTNDNNIFMKVGTTSVCGMTKSNGLHMAEYDDLDVEQIRRYYNG